jgi:hypothetical protein
MKSRSLLVLAGMCSVAVAQPGVEDPAPAPPPPPPSVMAKRWAIGLALGADVLVPDTTSTQKLSFGTLELAGRFRIKPAMELALALHGGGAMKGEVSAAGLYLDFRYRFMAEQPLNVYVLGGLGVLAVANENAPEAEKQGRGTLRIGSGVERRFNWFALSAEMRIVGVGENADVTEAMPPTLANQLARYSLSGFSVALGASLYF